MSMEWYDNEPPKKDEFQDKMFNYRSKTKDNSWFKKVKSVLTPKSLLPKDIEKRTILK